MRWDIIRQDSKTLVEVDAQMEGEQLKVFINILDFLGKKDLWLVSDFNGKTFLWFFGHNFFLFSELKFLTRKSICRKLINYLHIFFSHAFHIKLILSFQKKIPGGLKLVDKSQNIVMVINTWIMKIILNCKSVRSLWVHSFKSLSSHLEVERVTRDDSRFKKGGV